MKLLLAFLMATSAFAQDSRTVVPLDAAERDHVLTEMRGFLGFVEKTLTALAHDDFGSIQSPAAGHARMPPGIAQKLPPAFRKLAMSTHQQIDSIAADAARRDMRHSLGQTARLLSTCNTCHAAYRF